MPTSQTSFGSTYRKANELLLPGKSNPEEDFYRSLARLIAPDDTYRQWQREYFDTPAGFVRDCIIWKPDERGPAPYQEEGLEAVVKHIRYAIRGPHGLGKTALAAWLVLWFALTRDGLYDWKVPTTAGVWRQLEQYLWPEIHKWEARLDWEKIGRDPWVRGQESLDLSLKLETGRAFAVASDNHQMIEGAHADQILYVYDESKAIPNQTFDASEGALSAHGVDGKVAMAAMFSTPGGLTGRFYAVHSKKPGFEDWKTRHVTKDEVVAAGRMSEAWARQRALQWGEESALYKNRVLGEFAAEDKDAIVPISWIEAANERWHKLVRQWEKATEVYEKALARTGDENKLEELEQLLMPELSCVACDVADSGDDSTIVARRYGRTFVEALDAYTKQDTMATTGHVVAALREHPAYEHLALDDTPAIEAMDEDAFDAYVEESDNAPVAVIDSIGVGAGTAARLKELGVKTLAFVASQAAKYNGRELKDRTGVMAFANRKAAAWWNLREMLDPQYNEGLALPPDDELTGDLTTPTWRMVSGGRIQVEKKEDIKKRIGRSTDRGDAVVMLFADLIFSPPRQLHWIEMEDEGDADLGLGKGLSV